MVWANSEQEFGSEALGFLAAIIILLIAFGSIVAMGLPLSAAVFGLITGFALIAFGANVWKLPLSSPQFAAMIGTGVGIDYSLLVVTRFREGLHTGKSVEAGVVLAVTTAGRSVVFAGIVVSISFLGLFVVGLPFVAALGRAGGPSGCGWRAGRRLVATGGGVSSPPAHVAPSAPYLRGCCSRSCRSVRQPWTSPTRPVRP